jgi:hypothetical protein
MPAKSGVSHVFAAIVALLLSPLVKEMWLELVDTQDILEAVEAAGSTVADHPFIPAGDETVAVVLTIGTLVALMFLWGYAYHVKRHGTA